MVANIQLFMLPEARRVFPFMHGLVPGVQKKSEIVRKVSHLIIKRISKRWHVLFIDATIYEL